MKERFEGVKKEDISRMIVPKEIRWKVIFFAIEEWEKWCKDNPKELDVNQILYIKGENGLD